jgi:hypothetical protein
VSRLSNVGVEEADDVDGADGVEVEGVDDCCAIAAAGSANKKRREARRCDFIAVLLTRIGATRAVAMRHHEL